MTDEVASPITVGMLLDDRLEVLEPVGAGSMGAVWLVHDRNLRKVRVIKVARETDDATRKRFHNECTIGVHLARLDGVVCARESFELADGTPVMVMDHVRGTDLQTFLNVGPLSADATVALGKGLLDRLARIHGRHVVHRDLKPENVMLVATHSAPRWRVVVLDFGVAKLLDLTGLGDRARTVFRTAEATVLGTPLYLSPEQVVDALNVDPRADLWATAAILFFALTGRHHVTGRDVTELILRVAKGEIERDPRRVRAGLPIGFTRFFEKALASEIERRFQSTNEMLDALERIDLAATTDLPGATPFASSADARPRDGTAGNAPPAGESTLPIRPEPQRWTSPTSVPHVVERGSHPQHANHPQRAHASPALARAVLYLGIVAIALVGWAVKQSLVHQPDAPAEAEIRVRRSRPVLQAQGESVVVPSSPTVVLPTLPTSSSPEVASAAPSATRGADAGCAAGGDGGGLGCAPERVVADVSAPQSRPASEHQEPSHTGHPLPPHQPHVPPAHPPRSSPCVPHLDPVTRLLVPCF